MYGWAAVVLAILISQATPPAWGQAFSSGSTGSLGALAPASNTTVVLPADGILNYTTVTIPAGVTVTFQRNAANKDSEAHQPPMAREGKGLVAAVVG